MRTRRIVTAAAVAALAIAAGASGAAAVERQSRVEAGLKLAPVPLVYAKKDRRLVGLGSYLVNAIGGCNDCHTNPAYLAGGDPFAGEAPKINVAGYLAGGRPFGPVTSTNLTPDAAGLPGGLTFRAFKAAMRLGRDPDDASRILQVMPWPVYANLTDRDLYAIYAYLKAIPSRPGGSPTPPAP